MQAGKEVAPEVEMEGRVDIGLSREDARGVVQLLYTLLADEFLLYTKTRNYHWNVTGPHFGSLHRLFEEQYKELNLVVDDVAERIRALGGWSPGTLQEFLRYARLGEEPGKRPDYRTMIADLTADHEALARHLRRDLGTCEEQYHDAVTSNFLQGLVERHEKTAWMLRALLVEPKG